MASQTCYLPSGQRTPDSDTTYVLCNTTAPENGGHSACCVMGDFCLTNGLCKQRTSDWNDGWRVGCTDPTFQDPACPNYCRGVPDGSAVGADDRHHLILQCPNHQWCCSTGDPNGFNRQEINQTCCSDPDLVFNGGDALFYLPGNAPLAIHAPSPAAEGVVVTSVTTVTLSDPTSTAVALTFTFTVTPTRSPSSPSSITSSTSPTASPESAALSSTAKLTLGIAIPLALLLLAAFSYFSWWFGRRTLRRKYINSSSSSSDGFPIIGGGGGGEKAHGEVFLSELDNRPYRAELGDGDGDGGREREVAEMGLQRTPMLKGGVRRGS